MEDLKSILAGHTPKEPPEIAAIKTYVLVQFQAKVSVALRGNTITITVPSAALASTLRMHSPQIAKAAHTDKKLFFRIGG